MLSARALILTLALLALPAVAAAQPSFDCGGRLTPTERAICGTPALAELDAVMAARYRQALGTLAPERQAALAAAQRAWLGRRDACGVDRTCTTRAYRERIATLEAMAGAQALGGGAAPAVTVQPDGMIERPRADGAVDLFKPATGFRGVRFPDGTVTQQLFFEVQPDTPPALPPDYAGWSESVSGSVDNLVGNLLRPEETATLQSAAPDDFFERLDYNLKVLAFITGQ
jgi:uncharacterized protein